MAATKGVVFNPPAAKRIGDAVRKVERGATHRRRFVTVARAALFRMRVTNAAPGAGPNVVLARYYDGTALSGDEVAVRVFFPRAPSEEIYTTQPAGGTDAVYAGKSVLWLEMWKLSNGMYQYMTLQMVAQNVIGWEFTQSHAVP